MTDATSLALIRRNEFRDYDRDKTSDYRLGNPLPEANIWM